MPIRAEEECDRDIVRAVNMAAFGTPAEADLVEALRHQARPIISLVAEVNAKVVGHIMFSPVALSGDPGLKVMGLAPMAVAPKHQRRGIGSALVRAGLDRCGEMGFAAAIVLGYPEYYSRFGFLPSSRFGIDSEYDVPADVFMAIELRPDTLSGSPGRVKYHSAFANV